MKSIKSTLLLTIFLIFGSSYGQVNVEILDLKVNNVLVNTNPINFNGLSTINVTCQVKLVTLNGNSNNILGNLFLESKDIQTSTSSIQRFFSSITFTVQYPPFVSQTTYTNVTNVSFNLSANEFYSTGGVLFARYANGDGNSYLSTNKIIVGGTKIPVVNNPINLLNGICCDQIIRFGDKPALIGTTYVNPQQVSSSWLKIIGGQYPNSPYMGRNYAVDKTNGLDPDYMFETTTFKRRLGSNFPFNDSNPITITVVPSPIISNFIFTNAIQMPGGAYEIGSQSILDFNGYLSRVNLSVLNNPFHIPIPADTTVPVTSYQWQFLPYGSTSVIGWTNIAGANYSYLDNFTHPLSSPQRYYIRRIANYQGITRVSNEIEIIVRDNNTSNVICCNQALQNLPSGPEVPQALIGSIPLFNLSEGGIGISNLASIDSFSFSYQWQTQGRSIQWSNVAGATSVNFLPPIYSGNTPRNYRRIATCNFTYRKTTSSTVFSGSYITYSNQVTISLNNSKSSQKTDNLLLDDTYSIYPNPSNTIISLSNKFKFDFENFKIEIINMLGQIVEVSDYLIIDENNIKIDVSNFQEGIYNLLIQDGINSVNKKVIIER